jgi:putative serine protease PepD
MTDEHRRPDEAAPDDAPWWARSPQDVWSDPPRHDAPTQPVAPSEHPARPEPPEQAEPSAAQQPAAASAQEVPAAPAGPAPQAGSPSYDSWRDTEVIDRGPYDPWALTDTIGQDRSGASGRGRPARTSVLVALGAVVALLAGTVGGAVGYLLAERDAGGVTVDGSNLGSAPARSVDRPARSIPGVAARVLPSVVQIKVDTSQGEATGSGFVLDDEGLLVTNNHVVDGAQGAVDVSFVDGTTASADVVGTSASYDLAVLQVDATNLPALPLGNSDAVVVGDPVVAIGSPLGLSGTVTSGIVSAKNRPVTAGDRGSGDSAYIDAIQTDAAINPGNSGGPLVNLAGEVVGVNSAIATVGGLTSEGGNIGVGFAIPINQVRRTVEQIIDTGEAQFPIIGASLDGGYDGDGARIATTSAADGTPPIVPDGPAEQAGLQPGDVILAIDGTAVGDSSELIVAIRSRQPGDTVRLTVRRDDSERQVVVTLGATEG